MLDQFVHHLKILTVASLENSKTRKIKLYQVSLEHRRSSFQQRVRIFHEKNKRHILKTDCNPKTGETKLFVITPE